MVTITDAVMVFDVTLAIEYPITVVLADAVSIVDGEVPTPAVPQFLNEFAILFPFIIYPRAMANATAVPAGSASIILAAM